jgi:hypothetical protein
MPNFVTLTAVDDAREKTWLHTLEAIANRALDLDEDDLELPITNGTANPAIPPATEAPEGVYWPVDINPDDVREYYPRREGRSGTRIVYKNGAARPVRESIAEVRAALRPAPASRSRAGSVSTASSPSTNIAG